MDQSSRWADASSRRRAASCSSGEGSTARLSSASAKSHRMLSWPIGAVADDFSSRVAARVPPGTPSEQRRVGEDSILTIWGRTNSSNVQKVMWTLAEIGLAHRRIDAGGEHGGLTTDAYGAMNPNRRVPTIDDDGFVLWESNVIVRYLAARYGQGGVWPTRVEDRAVADQWMDWQQTTLAPDMRTVFWGLVRTPPERRDQTRIDAAAENLNEIWGRLDWHLKGRDFVVGDSLAMGDIPVGVMCHRYYALPVPRAELEHLSAWYERLKKRGAFRAHVMLPLS